MKQGSNVPAPASLTRNPRARNNAQEQQEGNAGEMDVFGGGDIGTNTTMVAMMLLAWLAHWFAQSNCTC